MKAMLDAIKQKMMKEKQGPDSGLEIDINLGHDEDDKTADQAPDLEHDELGLHQDPSNQASLLSPDSAIAGQPGQPADGQALDPMHMEILKGLADRGAQGRKGMSLGERAAQGAQGKLDSLKGPPKKY